ncbi:hypothetical protein HMN09_00636900 [Mycena chlorophos]|uniref:GH16 domain-containing protein n=1 Tax=Mycena chlorophos TaxID=658473 RepID=A0A8H6WC36_MYCCL|nr:hypothetical protein HMN09_00636900 [Mycena chlorophos]
MKLTNLSYELLLLLFTTADCASASSFSSLARLWPRLGINNLDASTNSTNGSNSTTANATQTIWVPQDEFSGPTFFDGFGFFTDPDPTHGTVTYVNATYAFENNLAYYDNATNTVVMKGDDTTWLEEGQNRSSVRVSSHAQYNTGLFILDLIQAPFGCSVWPAADGYVTFRLARRSRHPNCFTVDGRRRPVALCMTRPSALLFISRSSPSRLAKLTSIEGVHDNEHNQVTWHTGPGALVCGCNLSLASNFTGSVVTNNGVPNTQCDGLLDGNAGCGITEWSKASYGEFFTSQGGGVYAMKWDEEGIAGHFVRAFLPSLSAILPTVDRSAIPPDIISGNPTPTGWGTPVASLAPSGCDPVTNFVNHSIVFDITFCGDWAGNSYATSGCPGSCTTHLMDPTNYVNASWIINTLKVYKKETFNGRVSRAFPSRFALDLGPHSSRSDSVCITLETIYFYFVDIHW